MNCDDIDNAIYVYLDGELAGHDEADFDAHIEACGRCRALARQEVALLARIQADAPSTAAPDGLRDRVLAALAAAPAPEPRAIPEKARRTSPWLRVALPLATAAAAAAIFFTVRAPTSEDAVFTDRVITESVDTHQNDLPMEVRGSERQITGFLQDAVPFVVELPFADDADVQLVGARLTRVDGRAAVLLNYEVRGERMSVIQVAAPSETRLPDTAPESEQRRGFDVTTFRRGGVTTSVVGQGNQVRTLVRAKYSP